MLETEYDNHRHWPRYLDAVAGASDLNDRDLENILSIMRDFRDDASLTSNLAFVCRLIDVGILVGKPQQVLPISRDYFNSNPNDEIRLRLANNLHAVASFDAHEGRPP